MGLSWRSRPTRAGAPSEQLLRNGDFEHGTEGWDALWAREAGAAKAVLDTAERHGGAQALRIEHTGQGDWSLKHSLNLKVQPGEIYEFSAWVRLQGAGSATLGVVTRDAAGNTLDWAYGGRSTTETKDVAIPALPLHHSAGDRNDLAAPHRGRPGHRLVRRFRPYAAGEPCGVARARACQPR